MRAESEVRPSRRYWQIELMLGLLMFLMGFNVLLTVSLLRPALEGWADFRQLYTGGYMFRVGEGANFYDYDTQLRYEQGLVPVPTHLPANHLAYEHLLFVPLSLLTYRPAYLIYFAFNLVLAGVACVYLLPSGRNLTQRWKLFVPCMLAAFLPIWRALVQGQDSILLLALLAGAMFALQNGRHFEAGLLIGAGLFKFQIVIPIALLFMAAKHWRFIRGFCISAAAALSVSVWMVGINGARDYLRMMAGMSVHLKSEADVARYATSPLVMLNLRGLITGVFGTVLPHAWVQGLIGAASMAVLVAAGWKLRATTGSGNWRTDEFSLAVLVAGLVSYHFIEHDASILIIPVTVALASLSTYRGAAAIAVVLGMLLGLAPQYGFLAAVPILALFVAEIKDPQLSNRTPA